MMRWVCGVHAGILTPTGLSTTTVSFAIGKLDLEPTEVRTGADGDMLGVAIVRVHLDVIRLRRLDVLDAAHDGVEICFRLQFAVDEHIANARRRIGVVFDLRRRPHIGMKDVTGILGKIAFAFG